MTPKEAIKCEKCLHRSVCEKKTCAECQGSGCDECELYDLYNGVPYIEDCEDFIDADLINRQQAEIEGLQEECDCLGCECEWLKAYLKNAETEAIKEFAKRLKEEAIDIIVYNKVVRVSHIDNLVKEMVGESNV